jgi:hypothetical protein
MMAKTAHGDTEMFISRAERGLSNADLRVLHETLDDRDARAAFVIDKVPVTLGRRLAAQLPRATAEYVPGGHFAALAHRDRIINQIAG